MKLRWLHIEGFRSIREFTLEVDDFLCFIGQNNHGKSNILKVLDLFFSSGTKGIIPHIFFVILLKVLVQKLNIKL